MSSVPFNISPSDWLFLPTEDPPLELLGNTSIHRSKFYGKEGSSANLSRVLRTCRGADTNRRLNGLGLRGDARDSPPLEKHRTRLRTCGRQSRSRQSRSYSLVKQTLWFGPVLDPHTVGAANVVRFTPDLLGLVTIRARVPVSGSRFRIP
jgi:hypothetical protein